MNLKEWIFLILSLALQPKARTTTTTTTCTSIILKDNECLPYGNSFSNKFDIRNDNNGNNNNDNNGNNINYDKYLTEIHHVAHHLFSFIL